MFDNTIINFSDNLNAIRDFIDNVEPIIDDKIKSGYGEGAKDIEILRIAIEKVTQMEGGEFSLTDEIRETLQENFDGNINISQAKDGDGFTLALSGDGAERFEKTLRKLRRIDSQKNLLYKSAIMSVISSVECFLADVLHEYFDVFNDEVYSLVPKRDKQFTLNELEQFDSMDDAKKYIVDNKIEDLIRGSFEDWYDFLKDKLHLNMAYLDKYKDQIIEVFQRRNIVVHNKGIVNSIYLSKVAKCYGESVNNGELIVLDRKYLEDTIDVLEANFTLILCELWKKRKKGDHNRFNTMTKLVAWNMDTKRWKVVEAYTTFIIKDSLCPQKYKLQAQINNWLATKKMGELEKIKKDILENDFSAYSIEYQVYHAALLDDNVKVLLLLENAIDSSLLDIKTVERWPVFEEFRLTANYTELKNKYGITEETKIIDIEELDLIDLELNIMDLEELLLDLEEDIEEDTE